MTEIFEDSTLKVQRAKRHIQELTDVIDTWNRESPPEWNFELKHSENGEFAVKFDAHLPAIPKVFGAIIGDIIHNLRAALDLMATALVIKTGGNGAGVYFPFADDQTNLDDMIKRRNFHRAGDRAVDLLKTLEPYKGGNLLLRAIHDLDVDDKHRNIIEQMKQNTSPVIQFREGKLPTVAPDSESPTTLTLGKDSPLAEREIIQTLHEMVELVEGIIEAFAALS